MKIKNIYSYLLIFPILLATSSCKELEIETYSEERTVVFISETTEYGSTYLTSSNFNTVFSSDAVIRDSVRMRIQGMPITEEVKIKLTTEKNDDYDLCGINFEQEYVTFTPDSSIVWVYFNCINITEGKTTGANIIVDPSSELQAGSIERSKYLVLAINDFTFDWDKINYTAEKYAQYMEPYIGPASYVKIKFMLYAGPYTSMSSYNTYFSYSDYYANYVTTKLVTALDTYNAEHPDEPLREEDGSLLTFAPAE